MGTRDRLPGSSSRSQGEDSGPEVTETELPLVPVEASADRPARPPANRAEVVIGALAIVYFLYWSRAVLLPLVIAVMVAFTLRPVVRRLRKYRIPETLSAAVLLASLVGVMVAGMSSVVGPIGDWVRSAPQQAEKLKVKLASVKHQWHILKQTTSTVEQLSGDDVSNRPLAVAIQPSELSSNLAVVSSTADWLASTLIVIVMAFFLLISGDQLLNGLLTTLPTFRDKRRTVELVYDVERGITRYLMTVSAINLGVGIMTSIIMVCVGMPNPIMWGALAMFLNYVPVIGPIGCFCLLSIASILTFDSFAYATVPPLAFAVMTTIEGNFITPMVLGRSISLNPILVFVALMFWGWMWGIGGAVLAVPLLAVAKISAEAFESTKDYARLISA